MHIYIASLQENRWNDQADSIVLQRALCAVDSETWPTDLCYVIRQYENVVPAVSALKPYAEPSPFHEHDGYQVFGQDEYGKTAISLDAYAQRCQAGTGRDDILSCMDALRRFFLERLAELESDTAKADRGGTEDGGAQERSQRGEVPSGEVEESTASYSAREFAAASGREPERHEHDDEDALAAGRANDSSHPSRENVETRGEPDGAGDAAMSSGIEGFDNEREGVDVRLPAAASPTPHRMQVGEALAEADATRDEPSKAIVGTVHGAEDEGCSVEEGVRRVGEEGVRSVERQRGADDGERAGEQETSVVVNEEGAKVDDRHGQTRLVTGAAVRFKRSDAAASYASPPHAAGCVAAESDVGPGVVVARNAVPYISLPSVGEVEPPSTGEKPPSTGRSQPRSAGGVESSPSEVRSSPSEGERSPLTDDDDHPRHPGAGSHLSDGVVRPLEASQHQPSAGEGSGPSDGGQPGEGLSKGRQPGEV
ncbi:hypothetical protein K525DRAFT_275087 [Schizophyllum commune Loenen D]|nr:hypothetical protein K525DRAFT_275087 [Schizophyllum commune Loenen D]